MDETVINGANLFFASQLGIPQEGPDQSRNEWLLGLVNGAPYVRSFFFNSFSLVSVPERDEISF